MADFCNVALSCLVAPVALLICRPDELMATTVGELTLEY